MTKMKLKYIGKHQPLGMLIEVDEEKAKMLIDAGEYTLAGTESEIKEEVKEVSIAKKPNKSWTEKEIKEWMVDHNIDIDYNIKRDTKKYALEELEKAGWL
jgi:hypothetical protein